MKKQILLLRKGKKRLQSNMYDSNEAMQKKLTDKQYVLYLRTDAQEVNYIDSKNIISGTMTEKEFDTIDTPTHVGIV